MAFEIVDMSLDERSKYRRLLAAQLPAGVSVASESESSAVTAEAVAAK
jgi:hypothetical protein